MIFCIRQYGQQRRKMDMKRQLKHQIKQKPQTTHTNMMTMKRRATRIHLQRMATLAMISLIPAQHPIQMMLSMPTQMKTITNK